ncbi:MAG: GNAT family N-acetyltransferase [Candidatus Hydrogenedentes bacterium]|nr:GNAT family N-acetyltransferase [Candidatus Hydrogenedentota bacterium]
MSSLNIFRATPEHLDTAAQLFDAYRVFYGQASEVGAARAFLAQRLTEGDSAIYLAVDAAGAGLGLVQLYPCFSSVSMGPIWILNDLYVAAGARGQRVGEALMARAREHAVETGAIRLELSTAHTNTTAQRLYERCGYTLDTQFRKYLLPLGTG